MTQHHRSHDRGSATESKFYLPATVTQSSNASRLERLWASLFSHQAGASR